MKLAESELCRRLHGPPVATLLRNLTDIGDGLAAQLAELQRSPTPPGCERVAMNLQSASRMVLEVRAGLMSDLELARDTD